MFLISIIIVELLIIGFALQRSACHRRAIGLKA